MIKNKTRKIVDNKYFELILVIIINAFFFIICNKLFTPKYEQVDDFIIMNLISNMDGNYSLYGIQMHPLICQIIILLYKTTINVNWYTIFLLSMQFISFTIIGTVFIKKSRSIGIPLYIAFIFMMYSKMLSYIQYTTVSMLCITSGFILLIYAIKEIGNINKSSLIIAILMILIGCMIRFSTMIIALPFIAIYFVCKLIKEKSSKIIKVALVLITSVLLVNISFYIIYNINPIYKEFLKFHDVRTYLHDYKWMNYNNNEEIFNNVNWSENDRDIFYAYCFGDEEVFNTNTLETLKMNALNNINNTKILQRLFDTFDSFINSIKSKEYKFVFLITLMLVICSNLFIIFKKEKDERNDTIKISFVNLTLIAILGMHCLFIFLNRPMFRVVISIYILGITILIYCILENIKYLNKKISKIIFILIILFIGALELNQNINYAKDYNIENYSVYKEILEYTNLHKENAYLYTLSMHDRYLAYSIYEKVGDNTFSNIRPLGDWDTYTKNYYDFKERYNIDNLMESLYKNDNVYIISGDVIWNEAYKEYVNIIVKYIKEHYNVDIQCNIVKEFKNNLKIYKLQEI